MQPTILSTGSMTVRICAGAEAMPGASALKDWEADGYCRI
jgi:hypothetical protein